MDSEWARSTGTRTQVAETGSSGIDMILRVSNTIFISSLVAIFLEDINVWDRVEENLLGKA